MDDQPAPARPPVRIALVGLGKIARDQHLPSLAAVGGFELAATVDPSGSAVAGVPAFADLDALLADGPALDAVAVCTPPQVRAPLARRVLEAGLDCLLEKPPTVELADAEALAALAERQGVTLYASWHTRFAPGVAAARAWLADRRVERATMRWREDVRFWHPGQDWIWEPGGMGVFDPGLNGLAILTAILPAPVAAVAAELDVPADCRTAIAARLDLAGADGLRVACDLDWRQVGEPAWDIDVDTDAGPLRLHHAATRLAVAGREVPLPVPSPTGEYEGVYAHFRELVAADRSDVDLRPLAIVADALRLGEHRVVEPFGRG